jgi:parallel beta-helix repeat protein
MISRNWEIHPGPGIALVAILALLSAGPWLVPASAAEPPDWVITSLTTLENTVKQMKGDVMIESGGELRLANSTLVMNCSKDGEFQIQVKAGGKLQAERSNITSGPNGWHYRFRVDGSVDIKGTDVSGTRGQFDNGGIYLAPGSSATIESCNLFGNQWYAVMVNGTSPTIIGCAIDAVKSGIRVENGGAPTISGNTIRNAERQAIIVLNSNPVIRNNRILDCNQGIDLDRSKPQLSGNEISGCRLWGIQCYDFSDASISGNAISRCAQGISVVSSAPSIIGNVISGNQDGVNTSGSSASLTQNTITGNRGWGVFCKSGAPTLSENNFTKSGESSNVLGDVAVVWSLEILVEESGHGPVTGADVSVKDKSGKTIFRGKTGDDGAVSGIELFQYHRDSGGQHADTPHKINVKSGDLSSGSDISMDRDQKVTAKLGRKSSSFIPGPGAVLLALSLSLAAIVLRRNIL